MEKLKGGYGSAFRRISPKGCLLACSVDSRGRIQKCALKCEPSKTQRSLSDLFRESWIWCSSGVPLMIESAPNGLSTFLSFGLVARTGQASKTCAPNRYPWSRFNLRACSVPQESLHWMQPGSLGAWHLPALASRDFGQRLKRA